MASYTTTLKKNTKNNTDVALSNVSINGQKFFKIANSNAMRPFFMSIVSDSNHWMFISSNGGLTAGRQNAEFALFPYYTDDKITESTDITGSKTIFQIKKDGETLIWEPFSVRQEGLYHCSQNLYKSVYGNAIIFEEINHDLQLSFTYQWQSSNQYGFVRQATITNNGEQPLNISVLDGLQNILPAGVGSDLQNASSNLVDAYKRSELIKTSGLGIFALSAIIVDKAEPSEALKANTIFALGLEQPRHLLSSLQLQNFRNGEVVTNEYDIKAEKGAYFINTEIELLPNTSKTWMLVANVNQDHSAIVALSHNIINNSNLAETINNDVTLGTERLIALNAASDGLQFSADKQRDTRHFSNTLFNIMRGGIFDNNYTVELWDFKTYIKNANRKVAQNCKALIDNLPETFSISVLKDTANASDNKNFKRLCYEYLPLKFSRRHGDPSRPWNKFSINTRNEDGSKILDYEGNWRDIFQNWEALAHSYPEFIENMIHKFLNATTFDGYNPYRVTKGGFDWETIEPDDPWSYIGYWGDHQIIYLLKFLEFFEDYKPGNLHTLFNKDVFVYANVPYKIKPYTDLLANPKDTIDFDDDADHKIRQEVEGIGADGALLRDKNRFIIKVNFIEKILATTLAKLSNFIPEGGIWMNTQRPEWNDANNALVGNGVSMVTLYYLYRFLKFFETAFESSSTENIEVSKELATFFNAIHQAFKTHEHLLSASINNKDRKAVMDALGEPASQYRTQIYKQTFSGEKTTLNFTEIKAFVSTALKHLEHTIKANKRTDGLYHAYNLMTVNEDQSVSISYLDEMLEGQVAVLSAGYLNPKETLNVLDALKASALFRTDQYSYLLYPNKALKGFMQRNNIPSSAVESSELLSSMVAKGNTQVIEKDIEGNYHFNGNFKNANDLSAALNNLQDTEFKPLIENNKKHILNTFEAVFNHKAFTGRSGTFYGYEGLGSIYWHMVSKLRLAVMECCHKAVETIESAETIGKLLEHFYEIVAGIGAHKSPKLYGAFPTDPYSHTPAGKGAQQPGMTGQVKEDILSRFGELGVFIKQGQLTFNPCLLRKNEFLQQPETFNYINVLGEKTPLQLAANTLAFTYCQVPVVYHIASQNNIEVQLTNGNTKNYETLSIDKLMSNAIFSRNHQVKQIVVHINKTLLK